ncbi:MAG TPA: hypothetical protein VJ964_07555 [Balneolaceae bacterium]|nr:hypothetical protein [Balneolaceae bacterium]
MAFLIEWKHDFRAWSNMVVLKTAVARLLVVLLMSIGIIWEPVKAQTVDSHKIPIKVEKKMSGAPLTFGLPFPKGALDSPDHVRVLDSHGNEIPSQISQVTTWKPADSSVKWIWVFVFATGEGQYTVEYGPEIRRAAITGDKITVINQWIRFGSVQVNTGKLKFEIHNGPGGFLDNVQLDQDGDGFDEKDVIAHSPENGRGAFLDIMDDNGLDPSKAEVTYMTEERGSGPLHVILRVEGTYHYTRKDNNDAPFVMRIHIYAGKSYLRVLNTLVYTGVPDKHKPVVGEHALIATTNDTTIINEDSLEAIHDPGWTKPNDRIAKTGLNLKYNLQGPLHYMTSYRVGDWWETGNQRYYETTVNGKENLSVLQTGPDPTRMPPLPNSSTGKRINGYKASVTMNGDQEVQSQKADGWIDVSSKKRGISIGIRNFFQEYPKEIAFDAADSLMHAYGWSPNVEPMSFARYNDKAMEGMLDNFAQGLAKTTELVYNFHNSGLSKEDIQNTMNYFLDPPVAHANPQWYADSRVFGLIAPADNDHPEFERGLTYKYQWMLFNQNWEPWYGMFDYGDMPAYFIKDQWYLWSDNEPAQDYMWWLEFVRTGNRDIYLQAEAASRHTMDVDQVHWPKGPHYIGNSNSALDYWKSTEEPPATPYLGMGRRHATQHWIAMLSAHVWVPGWVNYYYLTGNHRALDVAKETVDLYLRRPWGKHGTTGRRLYLSVWNLDWVYDATKKEAYKEELNKRVKKMLRLQQPQGGGLVIHRYGYSQVYASQGLDLYLTNMGEENHPDVKASIVENARRLRDVPPLDHSYESYLSSIHGLVLGYKYTRNQSFLDEALHRAQVLKTDALPKSFDSYKTQKSLEVALDNTSHLPAKADRFEQRGDKPIWAITGGMRVFGWTHAYNIPYLIYFLEEGQQSAK